MKSRIKLALFSILLLGSSYTVLKAQQTAHEYVVKTNYLLYLPDGYNEADTTKQWPLMVHLHGAGETGTDINKLRGHGIPKLIEDGRKFPFIVLSPQSTKGGWDGQTVLAILKEVKEAHHIDEDRVYLTGLSMGGFGTWQIGQSHPDIFAAMIPICGGGDPNRTWGLKNMPIWCFHGAKDDVIDISYSQQMVDSTRQYNNNVQFTIYPETGHESWTETYENQAVFDWMLQQKRFKYKAIDMSDQKFQEFVGTYTRSHDEYKDTLQISYLPEEKALKIQRGENSQWSEQIKPFAENEFFYTIDNFKNLQFFRKENEITHYVESHPYYKTRWNKIK